MKKIKFILMFGIIVLTSCSNYEVKKMDGTLVKDVSGNIYRLDYRIGVVFALQPVPKNDLLLLMVKDSILPNGSR